MGYRNDEKMILHVKQMISWMMMAIYWHASNFMQYWFAPAFAVLPGSE
jgi:hypothetical protein